MKEFMFIFRLDPDPKSYPSSPEKYQELWKAWKGWTEDLVARKKMSSTGKRLGTEGKVARPNKPVTNGPYVELKEIVVGYMFVYAENFDEAIAIAGTCPQISMGGTVEVRPVIAQGDNA